VVAGEASKSMAVLVPLIDDILAMGVDWSVLAVVFGGRVRRDLAGFAVTSLLRVLILYKYQQACWHIWIVRAVAKMA